MKKILSIYLILALNITISLAQPLNFDAKIAVVDIQAIIENSSAIRQIRRSIDDISEQIQKDLSKQEILLKKIDEDLTKKRGTLSEETLEKEVNEFHKKVSDAKKNVQKQKAKLEQAHAQAVSKVHEVTIEIIGELAEKYHFNLVLPSSHVLFAKTNLNITLEVISLLNTKLKTVKVNYK